MVGKHLKRITLGLAVGICLSGHIEASECDKQLNIELLNQCLGREFSDVDRELNNVYARLRARLPEENRQLLRNSETLWIELRDKDCEFEAASVAGGQAYGPTFLSCQSRYTRQRVKQLREWGVVFKK